MSLKLLRFRAFFCLWAVVFTSHQLMAQTENLRFKKSNATGYALCEAPVCVQRGDVQFFISNDINENRALVYDDMTNREIVTGSGGLKSIHLFRGRYIVGLTKYNELYMLAPDENKREFHVDDRSLFRAPIKIWHWVKVSSHISEVLVDHNDILAVYSGFWRFSSPTLYLFALPEHEIRYIRPTQLQTSCGLNCTQPFMSNVYSSELVNNAMGRTRKPIFENLEIVNFERLEYDESGRISIKFQDYPSALSLALVKRHKEEFKTKY